jgi:hypothetical protein
MSFSLSLSLSLPHKFLLFLFYFKKSFMNDFDCLENDEKFENNLFGLLKTSLLEVRNFRC